MIINILVGIMLCSLMAGVIYALYMAIWGVYEEN